MRREPPCVAVRLVSAFYISTFVAEAAQTSPISRISLVCYIYTAVLLYVNTYCMIVVQDLVLEGFMVLEASEINLSEYSVQLYGTTLVHYIDHRINQRLSYVYSCICNLLFGSATLTAEA